MHRSTSTSRKMGGVKLWVWACLFLATPNYSFLIPDDDQPAGNVIEVLNRMVQVLETRERHTALYERVALLEDTLSKKTEDELRLQSEVLELRAKIPALEEEIETIPEMRKDLAEFEAKIEKLVHDYEAKLSTLASEVIRLKKYGSRRKNFDTLSDGRAPPCPEVGLGMEAERVGDQCLYFSLASQLNWTSAHSHCQQLGGDLAAPQDLMPLKTFLHETFSHGPAIWLGVSYDLQDDDDGGDDDEVDLDLSVTPSPPLDDKQGNNSSSSSSSASSLTLSDSTRTGSSSGVLEEGGDDGSPPDTDTLMASPMLRDEGHIVGEDVINLGSAGSLRRMLDRAAMFDEDDRNYGSITIPRRFLRPHRNTLQKTGPQNSPDGTLEIHRDASVVDFILLSDPASHAAAPSADSSSLHQPASSNLEERSAPASSAEAGVLTGAGARDADSPQVDDDVAGRDLVGQDMGQANKGETKKARMKCMLLQQRDSLEYELIGKPCDELHNFVCDMQISFDSLLHE